MGAVRDQDEQATRLLLERYRQILNKVEGELRDFQDVSPDDTLARLYQRERLLTMESVLRAEISRVSQPLAAATAVAVQDVAEAGVADGAEILGRALGGTFTTPNVEAMQLALGAEQTWAPIFQGIAAQGGDRAASLMTQGVLLGQNPSTIAGNIRQALGGNAAQLGLVVRTATARAYNSARHAAYRDNAADADLEGWTWVSALDATTCAACYAMHGQDFPLDEELSSHPGCRCAPAPKVRGSQVEIEAGEDVFAQLSPEAQAAVVKNQALLAAYHRGEVGLADMVGVRHSAVLGDFHYQRSLAEIQSGRNGITGATVSVPGPPAWFLESQSLHSEDYDEAWNLRQELDEKYGGMLDYEAFKHTINEWSYDYHHVVKIREQAEELLLEGASVEGREDAAQVLRAMSDAQADAPWLYRGVSVTRGELGELIPGNAFDLNISSFSADPMIAEDFADFAVEEAGRAKIILSLEEGAQALNISPYVAEEMMPQVEWLANGRFEVMSRRYDADMGKWIIRVRQKGVFTL